MNKMTQCTLIVIIFVTCERGYPYLHSSTTTSMEEPHKKSLHVAILRDYVPCTISKPQHTLCIATP